jgi:hypothetical protein
MRLLRLALETQRRDLAAHTIVLAAAHLLKNGEYRNGRKGSSKARRFKKTVQRLRDAGFIHRPRMKPWSSSPSNVTARLSFALNPVSVAFTTVPGGPLVGEMVTVDTNTCYAGLAKINRDRTRAILSI